MSVYILAGCRTPIGSFQGQFERIPASDLGALVISEAIKRAQLKPEDVDEVVMGQILTAGQGQNPARQAAAAAKIPFTTPSYTLNMLCGSGLKSIYVAYQGVRNGDLDIVVAGGQENMTMTPHTAYVRNTKLGHLKFEDSLLDGLTDAFYKVHMGATAEHLAKKYNVSRENQDTFAFGSQAKALAATANGYFKKEIIPVPDKRSGKLFEKDEFIKPETTLEGLAKLRPAFDKSGSVTAGNSSGINDGAAAVLLCSESQVKARNLQPWAKIIAFADVGIDPMEMGLGPIEAVTKVLGKAGWNIDEVDLFELNEAFAVQSIIVLDNLKVDPGKVNVCGGAIALGHPVGASGARVLVTLLHNLERLDKKKGIAALCIGGGMGIAIAVERC